MSESYGVFRMSDGFCKLFDVSLEDAKTECDTLNKGSETPDAYYVDEVVASDYIDFI